MTRTLILGRMPREGAPATHVAAGPWCFAGQEQIFPDWEERFVFAPDPFEDKELLEKAAREAQGLAAWCIPPLVRELRATALPPLPEVYWDMALGCWLIMATQQIVGHWRRAQALIAAFGEEKMRVELLPAVCPFHFATEQDFVLGGGLGHAYTHWLFSRFVEAMAPSLWEKVYLELPPEEERFFAPSPPRGVKEKLACSLRAVAQHMLLTLPFPRMRGFSLAQSWKFSRALRRNRNEEDNSRPLATLAAQTPTLPLDALVLVRSAIPQSLRKARHPGSVNPARRKRTRVCSILAFEDTAYRLRLAHWRARGHKLVFVQHGGNYGMVRTTSMDPVMEYAQHAFITWGWTRQTAASGLAQQGSFVPLPSGLLAQTKDAHKEESPTLLYVGTEIPVFPYRMDSRLTPLQYVQYRDDKQWFFEALPYALQECCRYRPYFAVPGTLEDAEWLLPRFPHVRLCSGSLVPQMLGCRLLVLDHHGTTLLQALAANVPTVLFWDRQAWGLCPEADALLEQLAEAGVWHPTAESAAMHVRTVWDDVASWWERDTVREARQNFCTAYARAEAGENAGFDALWVQTLKKM